MLQFIEFPELDLIRVTSDHETADAHRGRYKVITRHDFGSLEDAEAMAARLNEQAGETLYVATDGGRGRYPRYDVVLAPRVGAPVSSAFNGDYYPEGEIVKVSDSLRRVETSTGKVFWRRKQTGSWISGGTWSMVPGHVDRKNPSF